VKTAGGVTDVAFPLRPDSVRLAAIGDMGTGDRSRWMWPVRWEIAHDVPIRVRARPGDNIYTGDDPSDFQQAFAVPYKPLLDAGVTFYAVLGNHDSSRSGPTSRST